MVNEVVNEDSDSTSEDEVVEDDQVEVLEEEDSDEEGVVVRTAPELPTEKPRYDQPLWSSPPLMPFYLEVRNRCGSAVAYQDLSQRGHFVVGQELNCHIVIDEDDSCSKAAHAVFQFRRLPLDSKDQDVLYLFDLGHQGGTYVNGSLLPPREYFLLFLGDVIQFGRYPFHFRLCSGVKGAPTSLPDASSLSQSLRMSLGVGGADPSLVGDALTSPHTKLEQRVLQYSARIPVERKMEPEEPIAPFLALSQTHQGTRLVSAMTDEIGDLTCSQVVRIQHTVQEMEEFEGKDSVEDVERLQVHLTNLHEVQRTILQMVQVNMDVPSGCTENLLALLDYVNQGLSLEERFVRKLQDSGEPLGEVSEQSEAMRSLQDALAINQLAISVSESDDAAVELGDLSNQLLDAMVSLQAEESIRLSPLHGLLVEEIQARSFPLGDVDGPPPPLPVQDLSQVPMYVPVWSAVGHRREIPDSWQGLRELTLEQVFADISPFTDIQTLQPPAALTRARLATWSTPVTSAVEYVEITITSLEEGGIPPSLVLCSTAQALTPLMASAIPEHSLCSLIGYPFRVEGTIPHSNRPIRAGDVLGIGMVPLEQAFSVFVFHNREWVGDFEYENWRLRPSVPGNCYNACFDIVILSPSNTLEFTVNLQPEEPVFPSGKYNMELEECTVCLEEVYIHRFLSMGDCQHRFCQQCVRGSLESASLNGEFLNTSCLWQGCGVEVSEETMRSVLPFDQFVRFKQFRILARLRLEPHCRWCPAENCVSGVVGDPNHPEFPKLCCPDCQTDFCFLCSSFYHPEESCEEARQRLDRASERERERMESEEGVMRQWLINNRALPCPKCQALIQKNEGCNHIKCPCGGEFCWICGETVNQNSPRRSLPSHYASGPCEGKQFADPNEADLPRYISEIPEITTPIPQGDPEPSRVRRRRVPRIVRSVFRGITVPVRMVTRRF